MVTEGNRFCGPSSSRSPDHYVRHLQPEEPRSRPIPSRLLRTPSRPLTLGDRMDSSEEGTGGDDPVPKNQ